MSLKKLLKWQLIDKVNQLEDDKSILEQDIDYLNNEIKEYDDIVQDLEKKVDTLTNSMGFNKYKLSINQSNELKELLTNFKHKHNI